MPEATPITATSVVTLDELKLNLKIDHTDDDDNLDRIRLAAIDYVEKTLNTKLSTSTAAEDKISRFSNEIALAVNPVLSINEITYYDSNYDEQTVSSTYYALVTKRGVRARVILKSGYSWPTDIHRTNNAITISYYAGYSDVSEIDESLKHAVMCLATHWYENRETVTLGTLTKAIPFGIDAMIASSRIY